MPKKTQRVIRYDELELQGESFVREEPAQPDPKEGDDKQNPAASAGDGDPDKKKANGKDPEAKSEEELRKELARLRASNKNKDAEAKRHYEEKMKVLQDYEGIDLEELKVWREEKEQAERERMRREGEYEKLDAKRVEEIRKLKEELKQRDERFNRHFLESELISVASKLEAINPKQVLRNYRDDFQVVLDEKTEELRVHHRFARNDDGDLMTPEEFLAQEKVGEGSNLFASSRKQGSGAPGGGSPESSGPVVIKVIDGQISPEEQARYDEAKKAGRPVDFQRVRSGI